MSSAGHKHNVSQGGTGVANIPEDNIMVGQGKAPVVFKPLSEFAKLKTASFAIADDAVATYDLTKRLSEVGDVASLLILIYSDSISSAKPNGLFWVDDGTTGAVDIVMQNAVNITFTTGALTGTTGADGRFTISSASSVLYLENRSGFAMTCNIAVLTG